MIIPDDVVRTLEHAGDNTASPRLIQWYRRYVGESGWGLRMTLSGMPITFEHEFSGPFSDPLVAAEIVSRSESLNREWFVRTPGTLLPLSTGGVLVAGLESSAVLLPHLLDAFGGDDVFGYLKGSELEDAYDDLAEAEDIASNDPPLIYDLTTEYNNSDPPTTNPWAPLRLAMGVVRATGSEGMIDEVLLAVVGPRLQSSNLGEATDGDSHIFICQMTGARSFTGEQLGGSATLTGQIVQIG